MICHIATDPEFGLSDEDATNLLAPDMTETERLLAAVEQRRTQLEQLNDELTESVTRLREQLTCQIRERLQALVRLNARQSVPAATLSGPEVATLASELGINAHAFCHP